AAGHGRHALADAAPGARRAGVRGRTGRAGGPDRARARADGCGLRPAGAAGRLRRRRRDVGGRRPLIAPGEPPPVDGNLPAWLVAPGGRPPSTKSPPGVSAWLVAPGRWPPVTESRPG